MDRTLELRSARPYAFKFKPESTALLIIDMQRDFLDPNGFGSIQCGNDAIFQSVRSIVPKTKQVLETARQLGLHVLHTREGHQPDLADLPPAKRLRQTSAPSGHHTLGIGDQGPMGRLLIRGEYGHDIIDELKPFPGEVVIDKPGKGSFWNTTLHRALLARGVTHLLIAGVTTECCVNGTFREAADRGFECCVLSDCTSGFDSSFVGKTLEMLCSYDGLFGYVASSNELLEKEAIIQSQNSQDELSISRLQEGFRAGLIRPVDVVKVVSQRIAQYRAVDPAVWTFLRTDHDLEEAAHALEKRFKNEPLPPLYGIPFAVKDNIDVAGVRTTAACDAYAYTPERSAKVVDDLLEAGALFVGKSNLDQLATGLSGCRSPYGYPRSVFSKEHVAGGSSSGSSVAVGARLVSFALGTDTAGSGRVPAAFNGVTGFKPTKGTLSAQGLVPACKSLDTISILAPSVHEARTVWLVADAGPDMQDPYAKPQQSLPLWHVDFRGPKLGGFKFGIPPKAALEACSKEYQEGFAKAVARLQHAGGIVKEIDWAPFDGANGLLYDGALLSERIACLGAEFLRSNQQKLHPAISSLFDAAFARELKPWDVYHDQILQAQYTRQAAMTFESIDVLLVPTAPKHPTVAEMEAEPLVKNAELGSFTHFANVLDLCGIALRANTYLDNGGRELPFGITLIGASGTDGKVFDIAREFERTGVA
ncbi:glutamyl-tRNA amidotransferase subunit A [Hortaea werneckii]|nr:glutamyl-tRNA amidotransferase subunit A [Hortaea werneckii]KAI7226760.1 glutamyl-tRNA amidotransferase subunit A [Hortaea werneckii]KAI7310547.1 glutamyl-tRNA amidotransferase subunit A [Hortaea werneckii]